MGLFGKKKAPPKAAAQPTAVKITMSAGDSSDASAMLDSDGFFKSHESKSVKGLKGIKQSVIDERIEQMEKELASRPQQQDYRAFDKNSVKERELERANDEFASVCEQISEKESKTKYKAIKEAITDEIDSKVQKLADTYDYLSDESYSRNIADFSEVYDNEEFRSEMEKEMAFVEKMAARPSSMPPRTELQLDLMTDFVQSDIRAKPIDLPDEIPALSGAAIDKLTEKFEEKYSSMQSSEDKPQSEIDEQEAAELERLRAMFG